MDTFYVYENVCPYGLPTHIRISKGALLLVKNIPSTSVPVRVRKKNVFYQSQ